MAAARDRGMGVNITTNGTLVDRRWAELVASGVSSLSISIDGLPETHDRLRGKAGAFAESWAALERILGLGWRRRERLLHRHLREPRRAAPHLGARPGGGREVRLLAGQRRPRPCRPRPPTSRRGETPSPTSPATTAPSVSARPTTTAASTTTPGPWARSVPRLHRPVRGEVHRRAHPAASGAARGSRWATSSRPPSPSSGAPRRWWRLAGAAAGRGLRGGLLQPQPLRVRRRHRGGLRGPAADRPGVALAGPLPHSGGTVGWKRGTCKGKDVWIEVDAGGQPLVQGGRVPVRYSDKAGSKTYRAGVRNVELTGAEVLELLDGVSADDAPKRKPRGSGFGSAGKRTQAQAQRAAAAAGDLIASFSPARRRLLHGRRLQGQPGPLGRRRGGPAARRRAARGVAGPGSRHQQRRRADGHRPRLRAAGPGRLPQGRAGRDPHRQQVRPRCWPSAGRPRPTRSSSRA